MWENVTFNDLKHDAGKALDMLINQPEVDPKRLSSISHSEGTMIAPRVAIDNPTKVENVVLMGTVAENLIDIMDFQFVENPLMYTKKILDKNNTGELSIQTIAKDDLLKNILLTSPRSEHNDTESVTQDLIKSFNTPGNATDRISIESQLKPIFIESFNNATNSSNTECIDCQEHSYKVVYQ